ncbi:hypothetical protein [Prauserella alba]|uniref:hypothetical protein n=1 Tax=Prauserella alba TaxID=176898 RepID=UPI0020A47A8E|nr:hypothetical protein [Prauserella alba]
MDKIRAVSLATATLAFTLGLSGCGGAGEDETPTGGNAETTQTGNRSHGSPSDAETQSRNTADNQSGNTSALTIQATGHGPFGLTTSGRPEGTSERQTGKLIVGPGSCLALQSEGRPRLLVFGGDADFVLRGDRPSVTTPALGTTAAGEHLEVAATSVASGDVTGVPRRCTHGSAETVLVIG